MLSISAALSTEKTQHYYRDQYTAPNARYFSQDHQLKGAWHGKLATEMGLQGAVNDRHFERLAAGKDPHTGEQIIKHRDTYLTRTGKESVHRAAWDLTFNAPKSVSLIAIDDPRVRLAHREAVQKALDAMEGYAQARGGGNRPSITTAKWAVATFEHDTARPVDGYPAPHLHTHAVMFNMTHDGTKYRSIQTRELFVIQRYGTAIYQAELALSLNKLGYERTPGTNGAPDIKGFTREYLDSESLRAKQIEDRLKELGLTGRRANEIIAHQDREKKLQLTLEETVALHKAHSAAYGNQAEAILRAARERGQIREPAPITPHQAVTHAIASLSEREAVFDHWEVATEALRCAQGHVNNDQIQRAIASRRQLEQEYNPGRTKDLIEAPHIREHAPGYRYTTPQMLHLEATIIGTIKSGQGTFQALAPTLTKQKVRDYRTPDGYRLNNNQMHAAWGALTSHDQLIGVQGAAGAGKSSMLRFVKEQAMGTGYEVRGMAPTSGASEVLADLGIKASTLQRHLIEDHNHTGKRLYFVDEASLMGTKQLYQFLATMKPQDRVLLVGDTRQHQSIEAGRIFAAAQDAGMHTFNLNKIERQRENPEYLAVAKELSQGNIETAMQMLDQQGRITEVAHRAKRFDAIAQSYADDPRHSLIVSPDNRSRSEINQAVRAELRSRGLLEQQEITSPILNARQSLTASQRKMATSYEIGDVIKYTRPVAQLGFQKNEYATVIDRDYNSITVERSDGTFVTYTPRKLGSKNIQVFTRDERSYAAGDRIQFTSPLRHKGISNRELGTIQEIENDSFLVKLDRSNKTVRISGTDRYHVDHGYVMTSYSSQGKTVDRVLVQIDTGDSRTRSLTDTMMAYVAMTRGKRDLEVYTDSKADLTNTLSRAILKPTAHSKEQLQSIERIQSQYEYAHSR